MYLEHIKNSYKSIIKRQTIQVKISNRPEHLIHKRRYKNDQKAHKSVTNSIRCQGTIKLKQQWHGCQSHTRIVNDGKGSQQLLHLCGAGGILYMLLGCV